MEDNGEHCRSDVKTVHKEKGDRVCSLTQKQTTTTNWLVKITTNDILYIVDHLSGILRLSTLTHNKTIEYKPRSNELL